LLHPFLLQYFQFLAVQHQGTRTLKTKHLKASNQRSLKTKQLRRNYSLLGEPDTRTTLDDGNEQWRYFMYNNQFNASTFIPVVGLLTGGSQTQSKTLEIDFNGETVSKWTFSTDNNNTKSGILN
jgi:hypothetical protein